MATQSYDFAPTRESLLERLKDCEDRATWQDFFNTYWRLLYGVALKAGLTDQEAQDAVQETIIAVARHIPEFKYDRKACSFKSWLLLIARQRIVHQFRKREKPGGGNNLSAQRTSNDTTATCAINRVPDPASLDLDAVWDQEWEKNLMAAALERVKAKVSARLFQIFDLHVLQNWPVSDVMRSLRVSAGQVYLAKHRINRLLKKEAARLEKG